MAKKSTMGMAQNREIQHRTISTFHQQRHALGMIFFDGFTLRHTAMKIIS
jgi:hypothetical protein